MANYKKAFNFKHGVQVDVDNFVVNSIGNVGVGTSAPGQLLDVYGTARVNGLTTTTTLAVTGDSQFYSDVKIGTAVTISNGIVTATSYFGDGSTLSNIVGFSTEAWIVNTARTGLSTTLKVGIGTTSNDNYDLVIGTGISFSGNAGNIIASGIVTATSGFIGTVRASDLTGTISDDRLPDTITSNITGALTGNADSATVADGLQNTPDINVGLLTATNIVGTSLSVGIITSTSSLHLTGTGSSIGIGTNSPTTDLQIRRSGNAVLEVVSDTNKAKIGLGNSLGIGNSSAEIRFYNKNLELYNYDTGNIDTIIHKGTGAGTTGNFRWVYGQDNSVLLSLTYDGNLGINESSPTHKLHVGGASTFTGAAHFTNNVTINGTLSFTDSGTFTLPSVVSNTNLNTSSGVSTISRIYSAGTGSTITVLDSNTINVGNINVTGVASISSSSELVVPNLTNAEQTGLTTSQGTIIYNTEAAKFRGYTSLGWVDFH
jgi:hypothetical protein